jgi:pyrophosphatase PpaX
MRIDAILWDLDGTLVSTWKLYVEAYRRALHPFLGRELTDAEIFATQSRSELGFLRHHAGDQFDACLEEFNRHYADLHETHFGGVYDGVLPVLDEIRNRGIKTGIVTGKARSSFNAGIAMMNLGDFDVLVMDDDVKFPKPDPEGLLIALRELSVAPERAIYVGDSTSDLRAAVAARVIPAAVLWSKRPEQRSDFIERAGELTSSFLELPGDVLDLL